MTTPATSVVRYSRFFSLRRVGTVLDYGAGTLRNALYLAERGFRVYAADLPEQVRILRGHPGVGRLAGLYKAADLKGAGLAVDLVLSTYVFNIIARRSQRVCYLENVVASLRPGGYLLMEVCSFSDPAGLDPTMEHYLHANGGLKSYSHVELDRVLAPYGFRRLCHYYTSHALAAVYRLSPPVLPAATHRHGDCITYH